MGMTWKEIIPAFQIDNKSMDGAIKGTIVSKNKFYSTAKSASKNDEFNILIQTVPSLCVHIRNTFRIAKILVT